MIQRYLICIVLLQWTVGSLADGHLAQFIADYFANKRTNIVTTFTCSSRGTLHPSCILCIIWYQYRLEFQKQSPIL